MANSGNMDTIYEARATMWRSWLRWQARFLTPLQHQIVHEANHLQGAQVKATDLRAGASLKAAGLMAQGKTEITNIEFDSAWLFIIIKINKSKYPVDRRNKGFSLIL